MVKIILLAFVCLFIIDLYGISFGFKTCRSFESETDEAVTITIYEENKMFQCVIPSATEAGQVYKCSDKPQGNDETAFECRSADNDRYGMLITVPITTNPGIFGTDDVCIDALIVNGPTEYDTKNAYIGDGLFGFSFKHSRYYDFLGDKPSVTNPGPFPNSVVYEGIPTCFEECNPPPPPPSDGDNPPPPPPPEAQSVVGLYDFNRNKYISLMGEMNKLQNMTFYGFGVMFAVLFVMTITIICLLAKKTNKAYKKVYNIDSDDV